MYGGVGNWGASIDGIMDKIVFMNILNKGTEKLGLAGNFYFQQDNDPKHTAHIVREWIRCNTPHTLKTPPQSPDMNPIEHLWDVLEKRIRKHHITSKSPLKEILADEWSKIEPEVTKKLVLSMENRLKEVIKKKGMATHY